MTEKRNETALTFKVAVNGIGTMVEGTADTRLADVLPAAILATQNERWGGEDAWEMRTPSGELLDPATTLGELPEPSDHGTSAFIQLKPGWGA